MSCEICGSTEDVIVLSGSDYQYLAASQICMKCYQGNEEEPES